MKMPLIFQDNTSTITLVTKGGGKMRNKTMRVKQAVMTLEGFKNGDFEFEYIQTDHIVADVLTKPLSGMKYHRFKNALLKGASEIKAAGVRRSMVKTG